MTPEQMTAALGAGWVQDTLQGEPYPAWDKGRVCVERHEDLIDPGWTTTYRAENGDAEIPCATPEAAVAVALLLLAAGEVAGGAAVAERSSSVRAAPEEVVVLGRVVSTRMARRLALDLLRAADEAEAQA